MDQWEAIAERKIREAMAEGAFDNLKGKGKPLDLDENPFEDPSVRMGHRLLRNNGFAPTWVEEAKDLALAAGDAERELDRTGDTGRFRDRIAEINRRIRDHNLKTPSSTFHMREIHAALAIERVLRATSSAVNSTDEVTDEVSNRDVSGDGATRARGRSSD
jgi:hypothetical protein